MVQARMEKIHVVQGRVLEMHHRVLLPGETELVLVVLMHKLSQLQKIRGG